MAHHPQADEQREGEGDLHVGHRRGQAHRRGGGGSVQRPQREVAQHADSDHHRQVVRVGCDPQPRQGRRERQEHAQRGVEQVGADVLAAQRARHDHVGAEAQRHGQRVGQHHGCGQGASGPHQQRARERDQGGRPD